MIVPPSDAFGRCFARRPVRSGIFDLGFEMPKAINVGAVIAGVDRTSNAWRAGIRDGDRIESNVDINEISSEYAQPIEPCGVI